MLELKSEWLLVRVCVSESERECERESVCVLNRRPNFTAYGLNHRGTGKQEEIV